MKFISPTLAWEFNPEWELDIARYAVSEKFDGWRMVWNGKELLTRQRNKIPAPDWFKDGLPSVYLDGELWLGRGTYAQLSSGANLQRHAVDEDFWKRAKFMVFDLPNRDGDFRERLKALKAIVNAQACPWLRLVDQHALETKVYFILILVASLMA